jgi:hypothetical protein
MNIEESVHRFAFVVTHTGPVHLRRSLLLLLKGPFLYNTTNTSPLFSNIQAVFVLMMTYVESYIYRYSM